MIQVRPSYERGHTKMGWLDSYHSFSFGDYYDPKHVGFRVLRVINDDRIAPVMGFGFHPHRDMEIITYVLEGALEHKDSLGNGSVIRAGDVQRMSAGTGILHSEFNASQTEPVHLLQIWILPERQGLPPSYEQRTIAAEEKRGRLRLIASRDGREGSVTVHQDVDVYAAVLAPGDEVVHALQPHRHAWVQVARGDVTLNGVPLQTGDGAAVSEEESITLRANVETEVLVFDLS
ncbi:MAG: pirin family protein [Abditibacteriales bacterium]|nr:pirin family protein [Abditibacteriales bacterium]MDW8365983.1 pirin family protein [Abditibacteriales bacterium]